MKILFINSVKHWTNGWLIKPELVRLAMDSLKKAEVDVAEVEVSSLAELESTLNNAPEDTLLWPNAYYVQHGNGVEWIQQHIEARQLPFVGNPLKQMQLLLDKSSTHEVLQQAQVPIPGYVLLKRGEEGEVATRLEKAALEFPLAVKPTSESCSMGVVRCNTLAETEAHVAHLFAEYPHSNVLLETFLPSEDVTCGYLRMGQQVLLLPTYYKCRVRPGKEYIMERDYGVPPWGGADITMPPVTEQEVLDQLAATMPPLAQALDLTFTRADARQDAHGTLRYFDVNGMPALGYPKSVLVRQVRECFPPYLKPRSL